MKLQVESKEVARCCNEGSTMFKAATSDVLLANLWLQSTLKKALVQLKVH